MRTYHNLAEALDALRRGCIVDARDNRVPAAVIASLRKRKETYGLRHDPALAGGSLISQVRYEGNREIWWFWST